MYKYSTVMIIDDSEMDNFLNKMILETINYAEMIITYTNPSLALKYFEETALDPQKRIPEIVFLDINMPIMNGFAFLEEFKKVPEKVKKQVKFYVISSSDDPEDLDKIKGHDNIIKYLYKPLDKREII